MELTATEIERRWQALDVKMRKLAEPVVAPMVARLERILERHGIR